MTHTKEPPEFPGRFTPWLRLVMATPWIDEARSTLRQLSLGTGHAREEGLH